MDEKVIQEIRIVETEDGFRIEIKGDKEHLREMGFDKGLFGFGPMGRGGPFGHHHGPWGHHGRRGFGFPFGRSPWWTEHQHPAEEPPESRA